MRARTILVAAVLVSAAFAGCAATGDGSASLYVKDAPTDEFQEVHVVFTEAYVHEGGEEGDNETDDEEADGDGQENRPDSGPQTEATFAQHGSRSGGQENQFREAAGWIPLVDTTEGIDVNLLNATGTKAAFLGEANLSAGLYTQIAVVVDDAYGIDNNGSRVDITVPSGVGRIVESFEIAAGEESQIIIDLELDRALVEANGDWKLTPKFGTTTVNTVADDEAGEEQHEEGEVAEVEG